jgi:hypothetical protein
MSATYVCTWFAHLCTYEGRCIVASNEFSGYTFGLELNSLAKFVLELHSISNVQDWTQSIDWRQSYIGTIVSYTASAVKIYNSTSSLVLLENKKNLSFEKTL